MPFQQGHEYLYAVLRGEAEYDHKLVRIATKLIDFELPKRQAVAILDGGTMKDRLEAACARRVALMEARAEGRTVEFVRTLPVIEGEVLPPKETA
jgi:hypothetical protein